MAENTIMPDGRCPQQLPDRPCLREPAVNCPSNFNRIRDRGCENCQKFHFSLAPTVPKGESAAAGVNLAQLEQTMSEVDNRRRRRSKRPVR